MGYADGDYHPAVQGDIDEILALDTEAPAKALGALIKWYARLRKSQRTLADECGQRNLPERDLYVREFVNGDGGLIAIFVQRGRTRILVAVAPILDVVRELADAPAYKIALKRARERRPEID
jgi:hypothetical protein